MWIVFVVRARGARVNALPYAFRATGCSLTDTAHISGTGMCAAGMLTVKLTGHRGIRNRHDIHNLRGRTKQKS